MHRLGVGSLLLCAIFGGDAAAGGGMAPLDPGAPNTPDPGQPTPPGSSTAMTTTTAGAPAETAAETTSHKHQVGLSVRLADGYRAIATYNSNVYCGETDSSSSSGYAAVCSGRSPATVAVEADYGVARSIELAFAIEFGLEHDFGAEPAATGPVPVRLEPGAKFYFSDAGRSKLFVEPQLVFDLSSYKDANGTSRGTDFGVGALEGFQFDFSRHFGAYLFVHETIGVAHWLSGDFGGGIGIQARYP